MKILKLIIAITIITILTACVQASGKNMQTIAHEGWKSLIENNYSINYPDNWELKKPGQMGTEFFLFSPLSSDKDTFKENINLLIQDLTGYNLNLDKYVEISESQAKKMITDGHIIESKRVTDGTLDYQKVIYTGRQGVFNLKFEQYYWVVEDKAYVLTLTCEESEFNNFQTTGEGILNSFKLKN